MTLEHTPLDDIPRFHAAQSTFFESGKTREYTFRVHQLQQLKKLFTENEKRLQQVVKNNFFFFTQSMSNVNKIYKYQNPLNERSILLLCRVDAIA